MSRKPLDMTSLGIMPADERLRSGRSQTGEPSTTELRTPIAKAARRVVQYREDALDQAEKEIQRLQAELDAALEAVAPNGKRTGVISVDPAQCRVWAYADRPDEEADHADELAESFRTDGQIQPAVVRPVHDDAQIQYEVIAGHVRWRAAKHAGVSLQVVVRELDDQGAFRVMIAENEQRRDLSDRAKAKRFKHAFDSGLYAHKKDLAASANIVPSTLQYYLNYADLPDELFDGVDIRAISARWGYELATNLKRGASLDAIREAVQRIAQGRLLRQELVEFLRSFDRRATSDDDHPTGSDTPAQEHSPKRRQTNAIRYRSRTGQHLFSFKHYPGKGPMFAFPATLAEVVDDEFAEQVRALFEEKLNQHHQGQAKDGGEQ